MAAEYQKEMELPMEYKMREGGTLVYRPLCAF